MGNKKNNALQEQVKASHTLNKRYEYTKAGVNLSFTLNIKNKAELENFIELMAAATEEIKNDIAALIVK
jgi:hypothetical protein